MWFVVFLPPLAYSGRYLRCLLFRSASSSRQRPGWKGGVRSLCASVCSSVKWVLVQGTRPGSAGARARAWSDQEGPCALEGPWPWVSLLGVPTRALLTPLLLQMKEERFRQLFAAFGTLTDCSLKFTKDGKFRKFGFIGFKSEDEARTALNHFNKSFIDTSRVAVSALGSGAVPRPFWL